MTARVAVRDFDIEVREDGVYFKDGAVFLGASIAKHLKDCTKCALIAATLGAEIDGKIAIGESQMGLQARLMSYALRRLTSVISKSNCVVIFINQLRAKISSGYSQGPTETTTGGRALKFYSSVRIEVKRGKTVTKGDLNIGHELLMKVVKNKQAPPFRIGHTTLIYGKGVPKGIAVLDMAIDFEIIKRKGSWISYKGENLGQGKETVSQYLESHPELMEELTKEVIAAVGEGMNIIPAAASSDFDADFVTTAEEHTADNIGEIEETVLELDED